MNTTFVFIVIISWIFGLTTIIWSIKEIIKIKKELNKPKINPFGPF